MRPVGLVAGGCRRDNVRRALDLVRDDCAPLAAARRVLVKPNLTATRAARANSHADAVRGIMDFISSLPGGLAGKEIAVVEGSGSAYYERCLTRDLFETFGFTALAREYPNLSLVPIEECRDYLPVPVRSIAGPETVGLAAVVRDFDYRISLNLPKTHNYAILTAGIKNMMGLLRQEDKSMIHGLRTPSAPDAGSVIGRIPTAWIAWMRRRAPWLVNAVFARSTAYLNAVRVIHRNVAAVAREAWPDLVVIDAWEGMEGNGPIDGELVDLKAAVASAAALKADGVTARLMGFEPAEVGYLHYLAEEGRGSTGLEGLRGEEVGRVARRFRRHPTYPIQRLWREGPEGRGGAA